MLRPVVPSVSDEWKHWVRNPIDVFILQKLLEKNWKPSPEANRTVLARRVFIDLTGLPPTFEELSRFLNDSSPQAYEKLVDRLLDSPRYGERWARHWLDVAHYADSHGQDQDRFRPNAWPYRDYLIRSFNADKPYAQFVREQIAGDVLFPENPEALLGTGFLAAGPWDESGLRDINENSIDREVARNLDRDDIVTSVMTTFTGLTVHCARCHDHKFDPITQKDYYSLQAIFAGVDKAERTYDADPAIARKRKVLVTELEKVRGLKGRKESASVAQKQELLVAFEKQRQETTKVWQTPEPISWKSKHGSSLKALLDRSILAVGKVPEKDLYTITLTTDQAKLSALRLELLCDDTLPFQGPGRCHNGNLHLSEIRVTASPCGKAEPVVPVKLKAAYADFDQAGWDIRRAIDGNATTAWGIYPEVGKTHETVFVFDERVGFPEGTDLKVELEQSHGGGHLLGRIRLSITNEPTSQKSLRPLPWEVANIVAKPKEKRTPDQQTELTRWLWEGELADELATLPPQSRIYCGTNQFEVDGSFRPVSKPRTIHILKRGEVTRPGDVAIPGVVAAVSGSVFQLKDVDSEGARRSALANWLVDPVHRFTWRVMVNRVWHYHFGKGIVDTPSDFGHMGGRPSHPDLLDWLAIEFTNQGGSLKKLHKLIVTSSTYRQASTHQPELAKLDADNRLLWRMNRNKMDAETFRDAVLQASGKLDLKMYGPPVKHFLTKPGIHVTPEADFDSFNVDTPEAWRRGIYRFIFRTRPDPLLAALDCPDASMAAPVRSTSVSAPQALVLWNNQYVLRHSEHLAGFAKSRSDVLKEQIQWITQRVLLRSPTEKETETWTGYAQKHGLANLCRLLFNASEFLFID